MALSCLSPLALNTSSMLTVRLDEGTKLIKIGKIMRRFSYFKQFKDKIDRCVQIEGRKILFTPNFVMYSNFEDVVVSPLFRVLRPIWLHQRFVVCMEIWNSTALVLICSARCLNIYNVLFNVPTSRIKQK